MQTIVFDVETGPLAESELSALLPPFDPAEVKTGNLKDPAKIAEKIAEAAANHRRDFIDRAALDPLTGRVVAIGMLVYEEFGTKSGVARPHPGPLTWRYRGKTLLIGPDVRGDFLMERGASMLKVLVGGDPISAEGKGLNGDFQMFGTFNIVVTCNSRLRLRLEDDAGAWRRRLLVVRYEKPPPAKRILDFDHVLLREEGSGILRWASQ